MGGRGAKSKTGKGSADYSKYVKVNNLDSISRKQAGVIFRAFKEGKLTANESSINFLYGRLTSDHPRMTTNSIDVDIQMGASAAVSAIFDGNYAAAKSAFNSAVNTHFRHYNDGIFEKDKVILK